MKTPNFQTSSVSGCRAFSLIEMIGVLAVLAVSAAMLIPMLVKQTDAAMAGQESNALLSFGTALQNNIQRTRAIPTATNWIAVVAMELGINTSSVASNVRQQPRILLIDTNGFGTLALPYAQNSSGTPNPLASPTPPRFMIISSLGKALPALLATNGFPSSTNFNALWNAAVGTVPTNSGSPWVATNWNGNPGDITVQRITLANLFAHLTLSNTDPTNAPYSIDGFPVASLASTNQVNAWFLISTVFNLCLANTNVEATQVLLRDTSFVFSGGGWRYAPPPASLVVFTNGQAPTVTVGGCVDNDPGVCSHQFNWQRFCTNSHSQWAGCSPNTVCNDFTNYMGLYQQYAAGNFTSHAIRNQLQSCYYQLNNDVSSLCNTH